MKHKREEDMGRKRSFLGLLTTLVMVLFTANVFAAGYACDESKVYTTCNASYYLSDGTCLSCLDASSDETQSCSGTDTIDNGSREKSGTQQCTSNFIGGDAGNLGTEQCIGCTTWSDCNYSSYTCTCNDGYSVVSQGTANCSCSANTITLNWNENSGNAVANGSCTYNGDLILPSTPTRSGYTFTGWKLADGTVKAAGATVSGGCTSTYTGVFSGTSTAITAQWSQCGECTKGTGVDSCTVGVSNNTCVATATCSTGYDNPTCNSGLACSCTQNVFTVTVDKNGGSGSLTVNGNNATGTTNVTFSCTYGDTITMPAWGSGNALTKSNSTFTGWSESSFTCTSNKTVTAQWSSCTTASKGTGVSSETLNGVTNNQCQYTHACATGYYHSSHNTATTSSSINCSECTGLPTNAEWTGAATSNSCAWDCKACVQGSNAASCKVTKGTNSCTYTGTCAENTFNPTASGVTVSCSACPTNSVTNAGNAATECTCKEGYSVGGTQAGTKTTSSTACSAITYNITYELNGADANYSGAPTTYKYGTGATINGTPVRAGYSFAGWCTDSGLESCATSQTIGTTDLGDKKFYAKWDTCNSTTDGACNCASGTYPLNGTCTSCTTSCSGITGYTSGEYNICSGDKSTCYRSCTTDDITGATAVAGKYNYQDTNNCYATSCDSEYYLTGATGQTVCQKCPAGYVPSGNECVPDVFTITLDHNGGSSSISAIYLQYMTGWCADAECNTPITSVEIPVLAGQTFGGYKSGGTSVVTENGELTTNHSIFTNHATVTASWTTKPQVSCLAGTYYPGTGEECSTCPTGSFCTGEGLFDQDMGVQGIQTCESLNGTYTAATDAAGETMDVEIKSPEGAKDASYCFATNVAYAPNQQTTGSQTCKYDTALKSYTTGCSDQVVYTCSDGYALATDSAIACTIVDKGYYSPDKELKATQCPYNTDTNTYGTTEADGASDIEMCIMDNLWFENDTSGQRRKCYYSTESEKYDADCSSNIVTCIAGYWYDSSQSTTDCVPVGNGYYSPAQGACTGESAQPTSAGCSTERTSCGLDADGNQINTIDADGNITETASSATYCEGLCKENYYCVPGEEPQECPDEYPYSIAGSDDIGDCYKKDDSCACSRDCPDKGVSVNSCVVKGTDTFSGIIYQANPDVCVLPDTGVAQSCAYKQVTCRDTYYFDGTFNAETGLIEGDWSCKPCSTLGEGYDLSRASGGYFPANYLNGSAACYKSADLYCTAPVCPLTDRSEYCLYDTSVFESMAGWKFYNNEKIYPAIEYDNFLCPATGPDSSYFACKTGYDENEDANIDPTDDIEDSQPDDLCTPHVYTFSLVNNADLNDYTVNGALYQKYLDGFYADADAITQITQVDVPVRTNWTFHGYYTTPSALTTYAKIINADGTFVTGLTPEYTSDMTLYAWWTQDVTQCQAGMYYTGVDEVHAPCPVGKYCPGEGNASINSGEGCMETCPQDGWTVESGESVITSCHKTFNEGDDEDKVFDNGLATWDCTWLGDEENGGYSSCDIIISECDAGYYNPANEKVCRSAESGYWSPDKDLNQIQCAAKTNYTVASDNGRDAETDCYVSCSSYTPSVAHSTSVYVTPGDAYSKMYYSVEDAAYPACHYTVKCEGGYDEVSGTAPQCKPKEYVVTLAKNGGSGDIADSVRCTFGDACTLPATTVLTRTGYKTTNKWCTEDDGNGICFYAGTTVSGNISANGTDTKLYAIWAPGVFKVTLSATDAETNAEQGPVYLMYETGWFSDAAAEQPLAELGTDLPTKGNGAYLFAGYKIGDVSIINANGAMQMTDAALTVTTTDTTANVVWSNGLTTCDPGYYYVGSGSQCTTCTAGNYCTGGKYPTDEGPAGETPCPNSGDSVGGASATDIKVCYKEQMAYATYVDSEKTQARAQGTWTCNYDTIGYTNCHEDTVEITWCAGGYYYNAEKSVVDCVEVGEDHYSPNGEPARDACPDDGNTAGVTTSDSLSDCVKRMDTYVSDTGNASGSHVCNARLDGDVAKYDQNCTDIEVTWCAGGYYYNAEKSVVDCVEVGEDHYAPEDDDLDRYPCPHGGTTKSTTANTAHGVCQKAMTYPGIDYTGPAVHGTGIRGCYYDSASDGKMFGTEQSDGYLLNCGDITMTECNPGYYWSARTATVCDKVDFGFFGPVADTNNSNNMTARQACPDSGKTLGDTSVNATSCYKEQLACDVANGTGEQTRFYDAAVPSDTNGYNICYADNQQVECDTTCSVTGCDTGFSLVNGSCISCPADHVCTPNGGQQTCLQATGGTHEKSDAGTEDVAYCYTDCALGENAAQMTGRDYYGTNVKDTCAIKMCAAGYTLSNGVCVKCPAGAICDPSGGSDEPQSCATLTGGTHTESALGSDSKDDCFKVCEPYTVENGTAVPVTDTVFWPNDCDFYGQSVNGNPCDIVDGVCVETSCNYNFEMVNGVCKPCAREHAISYKTNGNCVVESCANGYHPNGQECEVDVIECTAENALAATRVWDTSKNAFGACMITKCADGYHLGANACQIDSQVCELEHGVGIREWNHKTNTWGECIATECDPGYTNDRSLTNELWEQCGRCNNMYSANGELAVSSYVQGCEIAACMYQGELYALENNECRLICDEYSDETGSRRWNASRKKCERTCEPGYTSW